MHLLKKGSKAVISGRKRKRYEVFDPNAPKDYKMFEEQKEEPRNDKSEDDVRDVTHMLKKPIRNKTPVNKNM